MKINDNVYFTKRPALKGKIVEIMPNGIIKVNFMDEDGILVKKGKMKKFEVGEANITVYREASKGTTVKGGVGDEWTKGQTVTFKTKTDIQLKINTLKALLL